MTDLDVCDPEPMINWLLEHAEKRPMLHGVLIGIVGLTVAQLIWALVPGLAGFFLVLCWAAVVAGYVAGNE